MKAYLVCLVGLLGCGSVKPPPGQQQDAGEGDAAVACTIHDTIDSCGASCTRCPAASDRQVPTCNGTACDVSCTNAAPKCSDNSCSRLVWAFDSNMLDGITPRAPAGLALAVRNHAGNLALAVAVTNLSEISFTIPICLSGNLQLQTKTLTATIFLEGGTSTGDQYYMQTSVPAPMTGAFLTTKSLSSGSYITYSAPLSMSQFANTATNIVFQVGSFGAQFSGTIWIDDIKIQ